MKAYIVDYIGKHSGVQYYIDSFTSILKDSFGLEVGILSNYQPDGVAASPFMIDHYEGNKLQKILKFLMNLRRFRKYIKNNPNDIYIYESYGSLLDVFFLKILCKYKGHLIDVHEAIALNRDNSKWLKTKFAKIYSTKIRTLMSHSLRSQKYLTEFGYSRYHFKVPHFRYHVKPEFDESEVAQDIRDAVDPARINLLMFGTITKEKGADIFIESLNNLPESHLKRINVIFAGRDFDGSCRSVTPNENVKVKFVLRFVKDDELKYLFSKVQFLAMPYRITSQSGVLEMAFCFKKPIIASNIPYFKSVLDSYPSFGIISDLENFDKGIISAIDSSRNYFNDADYNKYTNQETIESFKTELGKWIKSLKHDN